MRMVPQNTSDARVCVKEKSRQDETKQCGKCNKKRERRNGDMWYRSSGGDRGRRRRIVSGKAWGASHLDIPPVVTRFAFDLAVGILVLLIAAFRCRSRPVGRFLCPGLRRRGPAGYIPCYARERLESEAAPVPLAAWLAGAIQRTQAGIDGALVGPGSEFVGGEGASATFNSSVLAIGIVSIMYYGTNN